ncbi:MAG TPA: imidazolonepropionase [candidate division WOR-3 bacterium]|uniref:Imidazolonepropionase n=1 Tax=candidate division WOR-3 bacterium TaxID=2052148 RepID=A0A9C9K0L3_UNCW3|nr:imidazolonepropionase [candidate division WOR-3 bacterium]
MALLIRNASEILTMKNGLGVLKNSSLLITDSRIKSLGNLKKIPGKVKVINAKGCVVCPGFVDSHTHLVFGGSREDEFAMRISGVKYEKIAKAGGGIANTVRMTRKAGAEELYKSATARLKNLARHGTTTVEIKSGYGLSTVEETKILKVIKKLQRNSELDVIPTFLVHTIPQDMKKRDYVDLVIEEMIPEIAGKKLAVFCDIFCDKLAFSRKESEKILRCARDFNFKLKIHADQFSNSGGAQLAAELKCISADHLDYTTKSELKKMKKAGVVPTLLPGVSFFLQLKKKPNIKAYQQTGVHAALASDFNPGSCMIYAMPKIISFACLIFKMPIEDALLGATKYGAKALDLFDKIGSIEEGKQADLVVLSVDNYKKIPYYFGEDIVKYTIKKGRIIYGKNR